jgi:hypothetical protein
MRARPPGGQDHAGPRPETGVGRVVRDGSTPQRSLIANPSLSAVHRNEMIVPIGSRTASVDQVAGDRTADARNMLKKFMPRNWDPIEFDARVHRILPHGDAQYQ